MAITVLEIDEERIPKGRPPELLPIQPGKEGDIVVENLPKMTRFEIFGRRKVLPPRGVSLMSRIESLKVVDNILGSGQREERKLLPLGSDHPEEIVRYWNYARLAKGKVLIYRLGLALFARMAVHAKRMTVVEPDPGILKLAGPSLEDRRSDCRFIRGDTTVLSHLEEKYDFAFIDPVPYTGRSSPMLTVDHLPTLNRMIAAAGRSVSSSGSIALRGYRNLVSLYQQRCQYLLGEARGSLAVNWCVEGPQFSMMDQLFYKWALQNKRRVLEKMDYKFINAWARNTALTVT